MEYKPYDQGISDVSPSRETRAFHSGDARLRDNGFKIWARGSKTDMWEKNGRLYTAEDAHALCDVAGGTTIAGKPVRRKA